jgi:AsmA family protein
MKNVLRWSLRIVFGLFLSLVSFLGIVTAFAIPVELTRFKTPLEDLAGRLLGRPVQIEGDIVVSTSLKPSFSLHGLRIQNSDNFKQEDFLFMEEVRLQIAVVPLLTKKIHIPEIKVQGLAVTLEANDKGEVNWIFGPEKKQEALETADAEVEETEGIEGKASGGATGEYKGNRRTLLENDSIVVGKINLRDIKVAFYSKDKPDPQRFILASCDGAMDVGQPLKLDMEGKAGAFPYSVDVSLASLDEFLTENKTWVDINLEIAKTSFKLSGNLDLETAVRSILLSATVTGESLSDLNDLLRLDLPPFSPYHLTTKLSLRENVAELQKLEVTTGVSSLVGSARIEKEGENVIANIDLHAPLVQVDDFLFKEWSWERGESVASVKKTEETEGQQDLQDDQAVEGEESENRKLVDPKLLQRFDCTLSVAAEKVESGDDFLGSGELQATLKEGRINIDQLSLVLPGGGVDLTASFKPGAESSEGSLKVIVENFDIGILVRRSQPDSDMGGNVNLDLDVHSSAASVSELLTSGDGYFDFSGKLTNFKSGIIDLWAVNLISAIVSSTEESESQINCAVGRWSVDNGLLTSDAFFVDTSKIRICAKGKVNLKEESLNIKVAPRAKRAEFFSLATPVKLQGTFSDLNVKLGGGGVLGTVVKMIASPVSTPLKRMFNNKIPRDGNDVCSMELGPENRGGIQVPGCK